MVSNSIQNSNPNISSHYYYIPPRSSTRPKARSMRTIRSNLSNQNSGLIKTDYYSTDISTELYRLANKPLHPASVTEPDSEPIQTEITEIIDQEHVQPTVKVCVSGLTSTYISTRRSAAEKLRLLAKNCSENRALIGNSGAIPALIQLLCCSDSFTQEHAVTALLNLSLLESNKSLIINAGGIKPFIYVLKTGTEVSKQNAACALLSLALVDDKRNRMSIGASGSIPPLVLLLKNGTNRGKKDALTALYKLCSVPFNKERVVRAGAVKVLVGLVREMETGLAEKAIVVLSSLARIEKGKEAIVEEGGITALIEVVEDGNVRGKEFAVFTLMLLCRESGKNRELLVREGGLPRLFSLSQNGTMKARHSLRLKRLLVICENKDLSLLRGVHETR